MNEKDLFNALNELDDSILEDSEEYKNYGKKTAWKKWIAAAACLAIVTLVVYGLIHAGAIRDDSLIDTTTSELSNEQTGEWGGNTGKTPESNMNGATATPMPGEVVDGGVDGREDGAVYGMPYTSYAGPILPLSTEKKVYGITVERSINIELSPSKERIDKFVSNMSDTTVVRNEYMYYSKSLITDSYKLVNESDDDIELTLLYPFIGNLYMDEIEMPVMTVDDRKVETELKIGPYTGSYTGAGDDSPKDWLFNLSDLKKWEDYNRILADGYLASALDELPKLDQTVTVYELKDRYAPEDSDDIAPYLNIEFKGKGFNKRNLLTYGFNGYRHDSMQGLYEYGCFVPAAYRPNYGESAYLILLSGDIGDYELKAYTNGGCTEELPGAGATILRYECTLGEIVSTIYDRYMEEYRVEGLSDGKALRYVIPKEYYIGLLAELLQTNGLLLSDILIMRYSDGSLEQMLNDVTGMDRIMYVSVPINIPANGEISLNAEMFKAASYDYYEEYGRLEGYDVITDDLTTNLVIEKQCVTVSGTDSFEVIQQDFGFDIQNGVNSVELGNDIKHCYIDVKRKR